MREFGSRHPFHHFNPRDLEVYAIALYKQMNEAFAALVPLQDDV